MSEEAAKKGIVAGVLLVGVETAGGLLSGSLGLLSSAFNTLIDLVAAIINFFAVKESARPPDEIHMYGHEKIESAAALGEIALLLVVCVWIVYAATMRLASGQSTIRWLWLALGISLVSIAVDLFAYLNLKMSTRARPSLSIEASALHFLNDLLIAVVVILGLLFYSLGVWWADSAASLAVVTYVLYCGLGVVRESLGVLMDAAPKDTVRELRTQILKVEGVEGCHHLRVRKAGNKLFVDAHVEIRGQTSLQEAHSVASAVEDQIIRLFPSSDVLVHTEPHLDNSPLDLVNRAASKIPEIKGIHRIVATRISGRLTLSYHLEFDPSISVESAHTLADRLEETIRIDLPEQSAIVSHLEPTLKGPPAQRAKPTSTSDGVTPLRDKIGRIALGFSEITSIHEIQILPANSRLLVSLHAVVEGSASLIYTHELISRLEAKIKEIDPRIEQVVIHSEPRTTRPAGRPPRPSSRD